MDNNILKKVGNNIRKYRLEKNMTQDLLAGKSFIHRNYISDAERGVRNFSIKTLEKISNALDIDLKDLFD